MGSGGASDGADELKSEAAQGLLDELRVCVAAKPLVGLLVALHEVVEALDPGQVPARDAVDLVRVFDRIERLGCTGKALAAGRVAESSLWKRSGHRSAAHWMAATTGVGVGDAVKLLETAEAVAEAPATKDALVAGKVSPRQARAAGRAEQADPKAGRKLLGTMTRPSSGGSQPSVVESEREATRIVNAAAAETAEEVAARHHKARRFRHGTTADGMGWGSWLLPPAEHIAVIAQLEAEQQQIFVEKRAAGEREPLEAYAADALIRILRRARQRTGTGTGNGNGQDAAGVARSVAVLEPLEVAATGSPASPTDDERPTVGADLPDPSDGSGPGARARDGSGDIVGDDWSFAKVIVKIDLTTLDRGQLAPGEISEVAGQGPIPVADVWRMIDGNAFIAAVATLGVEISKVVHLGRRPTALQRTALEWIGDGICTIEDCTSKARLEIDHVADWSATHRTQLTELAQACGHHDLKTHHGYRFGPLRPDGRRALIPPDDHDTGPPGEDTGPPGGAGPPDCHPSGGATSAEHPPPASAPDPESGPSPTRPPNPTLTSEPPDPATRARDLARRRTAAQGHLFDTG